MDKTIVFDFDGVIHSYTSGWQGIDVIPDPPVKGIAVLIQTLKDEGYDIVVSSTRCSDENGMRAMKEWLDRWHIPVERFATGKIPAIAYVDDRAICFDGNVLSTYDKIVKFKTWQGK